MATENHKDSVLKVSKYILSEEDYEALSAEVGQDVQINPHNQTQEEKRAMPACVSFYLGWATRAKLANVLFTDEPEDQHFQDVLERPEPEPEVEEEPYTLDE